MNLDWRSGGRIRTSRPGLANARIVALFLLGVVLLNPPLLAVFSTDAVVFGIPILFLYLFGAWIALIALLRLGASRRGDSALSQQPDEGG